MCESIVPSGFFCTIMWRSGMMVNGIMNGRLFMWGKTRFVHRCSQDGVFSKVLQKLIVLIKDLKGPIINWPANPKEPMNVKFNKFFFFSFLKIYISCILILCIARSSSINALIKRSYTYIYWYFWYLHYWYTKQTHVEQNDQRMDIGPFNIEVIENTFY